MAVTIAVLIFTDQHQDIQIPAFTSSPVGQFTRQYRRKPGQEAGGKMGEKEDNYKTLLVVLIIY